MRVQIREPEQFNSSQHYTSFQNAYNINILSSSCYEHIMWSVHSELTYNRIITNAFYARKLVLLFFKWFLECVAIARNGDINYNSIACNILYAFSNDQKPL